MDVPNKRWVAYLQLLRLPNVFTAVADVSMGCLLATAGRISWTVFVPVLVSSVGLYLGGMVLNDVCDYPQDLRERPQRPLPSGRIRRRQAAVLAVQLLMVGIAGGWIASWLSASWRSGLVATGLAGCVLLYDLGGKRTVAGPLLMGTCRFLNVWLGISAASAQPSLGPWPMPWLGVATGIGIYVAGITWFARQEAGVGRQLHLASAVTVMASGILLLALFPSLSGPGGAGELRLRDPWVWPFLLLLLTLPVWRRSLLAVAQPTAARIQAAVKQAILTLILLDAAVCLAVVGPRAGLAVLSLLVPFLVLGRWLYST